MTVDNGREVPPFPSSYRVSGLLLHVTSLPSPYGIESNNGSGASCVMTARPTVFLGRQQRSSRSCENRLDTWGAQ